MSYRLGYQIAFILEIIGTILILIELNSIKASNLAKAGIYMNVYSGSYSETKKETIGSIIFMFLFYVIVNPFFSWLSVFFKGYVLFDFIYKKISLPEKLKEIQYKLGSSHLSKEQVKELIKQSAVFLGKDESNIEFNQDEDDNTLIIEDSDSRYTDVSIDKNLIYTNSHPSDYLSDFNEVYEYKVEGFKIYWRLLESKISHAGEEDYFDVMDGIVLESDIIKRTKNSNLGSLSFTEDINSLKNKCIWSEIDSYRIKYFIISKSNLFDKKEIRKYFRQEIERIKVGFLRAKEWCNSNGMEIKKYEDGYGIYLLDRNRDDREKIESELESFLNEIVIRRYEIENNDDILEILENYINNLK